MTENMKDQTTTVTEVTENEETLEDTVQTQSEERPDELNLLQQTIEELQNKLVRTHADFDNFRKRTRIEKEETAKYGGAKIVEALLPAFDNLERAIFSAKETQNLDSLIQGVEMVYRQIEQVLNQEGLQAIDSVGQEFNPEVHQAVMQVQTDEYESGIVVEELQKGYKFKDKVIRHSMVKVNA
ncbi:nucleotide exchange factor GrpE [Tepidibacillus marianensis]|uniref:nucleotide exchange factor GrpE n=1 Tax=Tepidibacillus marianensis TaxID=3131995 RepID=UPI0030CB758A